ncbi:hypothetical protein MTBBW1_2190007 [Desulfamplus magnetovallimortis]|uniref:Uncharacterized protein n=1 Tax=Desulfamplus magnetovallimortis TaxID=1246637 RepID=A0A1W1HCS1_9BACT|nr:hypothetical protein MTBBW1_2190007 [Desulfamplus magnetovallimortis]
MLHSPLYIFRKTTPFLREYHLQNVKYFRGHMKDAVFYRENDYHFYIWG